MNRIEKTNRLTKMAMLAAISVALMLLLRIPFPPAPFLVYDPADVPILISSFAFGPMSGILITVVVSFIQAFALSGDGIIGFFMHVMATGSFVLVAGLMYKFNKTKKRAVAALVAGSLAMSAIMVGWNIIVTPIYMGVPREAVLAMILPVILPFNLLKAAVNSVVIFLIYKPIGRFLK
ncbi:MAG: ECF transporter S component [Bacillota bacterium]|jgi:riboflavin transporter FmnP|nr:ECF transporter S component [Bacillota bacterium]NLM08690.1 ECF transporter S component [Clostridiales Family XIII bacterium]